MVESYPYSVKEGQRYINLNPGRLFVQQPPKRERDREAHLNYYASAYNSGRQLSQRTKQTKPTFGRLLRPPAWKQSGTILVEREGMDNRRK